MSQKSKAGVDWVAAKMEYAAGDMSLRDIAAKLGCVRQAVERVSARDGWADARDRFRSEVGHRAAALASESRAQKLKDWNDADYRIAKVIRSRVAARLNKLAALPPDVEVDLGEVRTLASILESTQRIGRLALGATTDNQGSILNPGEDGIAVPRLKDFYDTVKFEGSTASAPTSKKDDEPPTTH